MEWSAWMSLHQARGQSVDHVPLGTLMMGTSVQVWVCGYDILDLNHAVSAIRH